MRRGIDPGDRGFVPSFARVVDVWKYFYPGMGPYPPGMVLTRARSMASRKNQQPVAWIWALGSAKRMPILNLKVSSNAGFMAWGSPRD